jgi:hypothetical protein
MITQKYTQIYWLHEMSTHMNRYTKFLFSGTFVLLQACGIQHMPERLLAENEVDHLREVGTTILEREYQDPSYLPPGYAKLSRQEVEATLTGKSFTFVNPATALQFRASLDTGGQTLIRGRGAISWSGEATWGTFTGEAYHDRDKLCFTPNFCFVFSRFDELEGNDMLGARVHQSGQEMLPLNLRYWVFTHIDPINAPAD